MKHREAGIVKPTLNLGLADEFLHQASHGQMLQLAALMPKVLKNQYNVRGRTRLNR